MVRTPVLRFSKMAQDVVIAQGFRPIGHRTTRGEIVDPGGDLRDRISPRGVSRDARR
jgi:hypothetical protein